MLMAELECLHPSGQGEASASGGEHHPLPHRCRTLARPQDSPPPQKTAATGACDCHTGILSRLKSEVDM